MQEVHELHRITDTLKFLLNKRYKNKDSARIRFSASLLSAGSLVTSTHRLPGACPHAITRGNSLGPKVGVFA